MASAPDPIARAISKHLERHDITVSELAARAGIQRSTVSAYLHGRRSMSVRNLCKLLDALNLLAPVIRIVQGKSP